MPKDDETLQYTLSYRDAVDILKLVKESEHCTALDIRFGDMKLSLTRAVSDEVRPPPAARNVAVPPPMPLAAPSTKPAAPQAHAVPDGSVTVSAPMLGTFYRAPAPNAPPFVNLGDRVKSGDTVGLIEVMKLFMPITAVVGGRIVQIVAQDSTLVEHGQALIVIQPDQ